MLTKPSLAAVVLSLAACPIARSWGLSCAMGVSLSVCCCPPRQRIDDDDVGNEVHVVHELDHDSLDDLPAVMSVMPPLPPPSPTLGIFHTHDRTNPRCAHFSALPRQVPRRLLQDRTLDFVTLVERRRGKGGKRPDSDERKHVAEAREGGEEKRGRRRGK